MNHHEVIAQFRDAMRAAGLNTSDHIVADGKLHRFWVEGDHRARRNGWYVLHIDDRPAGVFGCNKRMGAESVTWTAKGLKRLSPEERRALMAKMKADEAKREKARRAAFEAVAFKAAAIWSAARECDQHPYLARKGVQPYGLRHTEWVRELAHDAETGEVREVRETFALLVPVKNAKNEIVSLQAIFPEKNELLGRDKDFLPGGEKRACYYAFGLTAENRDYPIIIAEGYATAASLHEATGFGCVVAFDAGNLTPVAEIIRGLAPNRAIIIAADNDQFTPANNGTPENPGVFFATRAAKAIGGFLVVPQFASLEGKPTDWNDLHQRAGLDAVRDQIMASLAVEPPAPPAPEPEPDMAPEPPPEETEAEKKARLKAERERRKAEKLAKAAEHAKEYAANPDMYDPSKYFTVLGHDRSSVFLYSHEAKLIGSQPMTNLGKNALLKFARSDFWKLFSANPEGDAHPNWDACANWLIDQAYRKGIYDPSKTRGRGAWLDEGRIVYHFGNVLLVDGVETPVHKIKSEFVYEQGKLLPPPADHALSDPQGRHICEIAKLFRWTKPGSAVLLAGWAALAPICGALKWRPHIWITGAAGSGKTTILNDFVSILTAGTGILAQGNSTEAGIRQKLQSDSLPVLFDESEQQDEKAEVRVQNIIALIRQASSESGAKIYKGTTNGEGISYHNRSMFCLCSIGVAIKSDADRDRLTVLALRPRTDNSEADHWPEVKAALYALGRDEDLPARLMRRALNLLPTTRKNIEVFIEAAAKKFGSQREGDQYGTLMAGAWSLCSANIATPEEAAAMIGRYDWSEYVEHTTTNDSELALMTLITAKLRTPDGELSVHEVICLAAGRAAEGCDMDRVEARALLARHGLKLWSSVRGCEPDQLLIANNHSQLKKLLEGTTYAVDLRGHLIRHKAIKKHDTTTHFSGGKSKALAIRLADILDHHQEAGQEEVLHHMEEVPF